ncbi:MAG: DUF481 domain-containing protein [Kiritimatiellales bacterium]
MSRYKSKLIILTLALFSGAVCGNVPEKQRNWNANLYGGFTMKNGNTDEDSFRYGGVFEYKNETLYRCMTRFDGRYRKTNDKRSEAKNEAAAELRRLITEKWFASATMNVQHDDMRDIRYRIQGGPGVGHYFFDTKELGLDISTGVVYFHEKRELESENSVDWRIAHRLTWKITENLDCWFNSEFLQNLDESRDFRMTVRAGINNKINRHFSLTLTMLNEYDNDPDSDDIEKNDFELSAGIRYTF